MADKKTNAEQERYLKIIKEVEKHIKATGKELNNQKKWWSDISQSVLGLDDSKFFEDLGDRSGDIAKMAIDAENLGEVFKDVAASVDVGFKKAINSIGKVAGKKAELLGLIDDFSKQAPEMGEALRKAVQSANIGEFMQQYGEEGMAAFQKLVKDKDGFKKLNDFFQKDAVKDLKKITQQQKMLQEAMKDTATEAFSMRKAFMEIGDNITAAFRPEKIKSFFLDFDKSITEAQKTSGIAFKENSVAMNELASRTAEFGLNIKDTTGLMSKLGDGLRTTDWELLSGAAKDMAAISSATGISIDDVGELGSQMMLFGKTSKDVSKFAENTMKSAQNFGVNGKKIMSDIVKNLPKFRQMGFQGGEESLKRMAIQAERLGQNIDEIFDVAKRSRTIEGALDMAAQLQLAGGSFANLNPMDLLAAARKGPEELQKILARMGADIGTFNAKTGQMDFSAVDVDRLQIAADATGMSIDSLQKQITKTAQDNQKVQLLPAGMFEGLAPEEQAFILNSMKMKDGQLINIGVEGVSDLSKLSKQNIQAAMKNAATDKNTLEEQAKQNMDFQQTVEGLKTSVMNMLVFLEPLIKWLTKGIQGLNSMFQKLPDSMKIAGSALIGGLALFFGYAKQFASGMAFGQGHKAGLEGGGFLKNLFGGKGKGAAKIPGEAVMGETGKLKGAGPGGFLSSLADGIKSFGKGSAQIIKGAFTMGIALAAIAAPIMLVGQLYSALGGDFKQLMLFGVSLIEFSAALWLASKASEKISIKGILFGSLAMGILGLALIPFTMALEKMQGIKWETLGKMAAAIAGAAVILAVMGMGPIPGFILLGALALAAASGALYIFGMAIQEIAGGFESLGKVDWASFSMMGFAMMAVVPGLLALGGVGLFALPGLLMMTGVLLGLAGVMVILAPALSMASQSMIQMAEGIDKLKSAVKGLDVGKLEDIADASERMATASAIGGLANAINSLTGASAGGGAGKPQTMKLEPITINLKLNGRILQQEIVESTAVIS